MKKITPHLVGLLIFSSMAVSSSAQVGQNSDDLRKIADTLQQRFLIEKEDAIIKAALFNIPVRKTFPNGQTIELMRFKNNVPVYYTTFNAEGAQVIKSSKLYPGGVMGYNLTGAGQILGIWDSGRVRETHQELSGRVTQVDGAVTLSDHSTHVAGTLIGSGVNAAAKGMSYMANLNAYDWNNDDAEMATAAANGLKVSQHSYGLITGWYYDWGEGFWYWMGDVTISQTEDYNFGFYSTNTQLWDQIAVNAPNYLIVKSAGNDRGQGPAPGTQHYYWNNGWTLSTMTRDKDGGVSGYDCIPDVGNAKNILTIGAVTANGVMSSFSSWGPTDDGRVKPDVVAKGVSVLSSVATNNTAYDVYGGTSMAGPMVSGSVGLLLQHQNKLHPGVPLRSATMKGLIIHSADDNISGAPGPDYRFGWGMMDTQKAAQIMKDNKYNGGLHVYEAVLNNGGQSTFTIKATGEEPLRATIVWTDVPGTSPPPSLNPTTLMLVNDLDLRIFDLADNIEYRPYVLNPANPAAAPTTGDNFRDNVEMVHINSPTAAKIYTVKVTHKGTLTGGNQKFSLIITGNENQASISRPQSLTATPAGDNQINLSWVKNAANDNVMLVWSPFDNFGFPVNGQVYTSGQPLPGGGIVIYRGSNLNFQHTGLSPNTQYFYRAFSYNASNIYSGGKKANASTGCGTISSLPLTENFNASASLPPCWQIVDHIGNGQVWQIGTHDWGLSGNTGNYAFLNSDAYGQAGTQNTDLISPAFDFINYTGINLSFTHYFLQWESSSTAKFYYSLNGGTTWTLLSTWTSTTANPAYYSQTIAALAGQANVKFKWNYTGNWGYWWDVDDIMITGTPIVPANRTVTSRMISEADVVCFDATGTLTIAGNGTTFTVLSGGSAELIAGQKILLKEGTYVQSGGYLWAHISTNYCSQLRSLLADDGETVEAIDQLSNSTPDDVWFRLYPNPTTGQISVVFDYAELTSDSGLEIFNMLGKKIYSRKTDGELGLTFDLSKHPGGIYLFRLSKGEKTWIRKVVKQ